MKCSAWATRVRAAAWLGCLALSWLAVLQSAQAQAPVCAEVRIEIRQKVSLERQAFDAVLRIRNGLTTAAIENIGVEVLFTDAAGVPVQASSDPNDVGASFFIRTDGLEGIDDIDGSGTIEPTQTGVARWLIIPAANAGGPLAAGKQYRVGARLSYTLAGETTTVDVVPETITVLPQPKLKLDYFIAGDVYADDAFTPELEPPVPFTFGVRVSNTGAGTARNLRIESAQPTIVENDQGLLIGFEILGGHVDTQAVAPSLLLDFGDIAPAASRMGRWRMQTTLSGRFTEISARYSHADALGGALTSLIDGEPASHLLLRDVLVDLPGRDSVRDYLARDGDVLRVYESNGPDSTVTDLSASASLTPAGAGAYTLQVPSHAGHGYSRVADPLAGASENIQARRADGTLLPSANVWFSKIRNENLTWSHYVNVFDVQAGAPYVVTVDAPPATASLAGLVYADSNGNGQRDAGETGLVGLPLVLSGTSAGDGNIERMAVSAGDGAWQFESLPAGSYAVVVGAAGGLDNGVHQVGSSGGVAGLDRIEGIELAQGTVATGYLFAKVAPDVLPSADLQLLGIVGQATVERNAPTQIAVDVGNIGPQATLADVLLALPETFTIDSAVASRGTFDPGSARWQVGALAPGDEASLVLSGRFDEIGAQVVSAAISAVPDAGIDPEVGNNQRAAGIEVIGTGAITLDAGPRRSTRLLLLATCAADAAPSCAAERALRWEQVFGTDIAHEITDSPDTFHAALRSGEWNVLWIDGAGTPPTALLDDVREAVRRGDSLLLSGTRDAHWERFEALAGVMAEASLPAAPRQVALAASEYFTAGTLTVQGAATQYGATSGRVLAQYDGGGGAIAASAAVTDAQLLLFGFDVLPALESDGTGVLLAGVARGASAGVPSVLLAGARLPLRLGVQGDDASAGSVTAAFGVAPAFEVLAVSPAPQQQVPGRVDWTADLTAAPHRFDATLDLRAPVDAGTHAFVASLDEDEAQSVVFEILVRDEAAQRAAANAAVAGVDASAAQVYLAAALLAQDEGRLVDARAAIFAAIALLDDIDGGEDAALEASRLLLLFSRATEPAPDALFADGFEAQP